MRRKEKKLVRANENSSKTTKLPTARENAGDQVLIDSSFASDWLGEWRESFRPITKRSKAKLIRSQITFDTQ